MCTPDARAPPQTQTAYTLRNPVHLQRDSLRVLCRTEGGRRTHHVEFDFTAECACSITIQLTLDGAAPDPPQLPPTSTVRVEEGLGQRFRQIDHRELCPLLDTTRLAPGAPLHLRLVVAMRPLAPSASGSGSAEQCEQWTFARVVLDPAAAAAAATAAAAAPSPPLPAWGGSVVVDKQEVRVGSAAYTMSEIYGIEGMGGTEGSGAPSGGAASTAPGAVAGGADADGAECVICMTDARDTTVLPCRHMCLCAACAADLRVRSNKCPICRQPAQSYLRIHVSGRSSGKQ